MATDAQPSKCPQCGKTFAANVRICPDDGTVLEQDTKASQLGKVLDGKYRLESFLSQGGMGAVYKATHVMLGKSVAVKLINPELVTSPDVVRRFQREARSATALSHPNIVSVFDLGQTPEGTLYIAMEFVDGQSLKSVITGGGPIAPARAVSIMKQVAAALAVAHRSRIIHRDLKPQNIMLTRDAGGQEIAKLVDFGIAKTFDEATQLTMAGDAIGTPHYMAPEQAAGQPVDARSDIYSAGIILYEMLSGQVPFNDASAPAILIRHLQEAPMAPSAKNANAAVPPALDAITLKCLEKDPGRRYQTAEELGAALDQAAATLPMSAIQDQATLPMAAAAGGAAIADAATRPIAAAPAPVAASSPAGTARVEAVPPPMAARASDTRPTVASAAAQGPAATAPPASQKSSKKPLAVVAAVFAIAIAAAAAMQMRQRANSAESTQQATEQQTAPPTSAAMQTAAPSASPAMAAAATPPAAGAATPKAETPAPGLAASASETRAPSVVVDAPSPAGRARADSAPRAQTAAAPPAPARQSPPAPAVPAPQAAVPSAPAPFPAAPSVAFQCTGAPEICSPLRAAMDDAIEKAGLPNVRNASRADVSVTAVANVVQGQTTRSFGTNFTVMNYAIEVSGEVPRTSEAVSMPPSKQVSFDQTFGSQRATEAAHVLASDIVDRIKAFAAKKR